MITVSIFIISILVYCAKTKTRVEIFHGEHDWSLPPTQRNTLTIIDYNCETKEWEITRGWGAFIVTQKMSPQEAKSRIGKTKFLRAITTCLQNESP